MKILKVPYIKNITLATAALSMLFASSCKKFTQLQPVDALSDVTAFTTAGNVELAAAGMYNAAEVGSYNGSFTAGRGYPFGAASIEQGEMRGEDMVNVAAFYQITYQATYDATTANNNNMFINLYALINQANTFIAGVNLAASKGILSTSAANAYLGEARYLRALAHFELCLMYCRPYLDNAGANPGVPYRTIPVNSQDNVAAATAVDRGTVKTDYTNILADLDFAETNIPTTGRAFPFTRATSGAAIALKTRVKLHMGDWAGVIAEGAKLGVTGTGTSKSTIGGYALTSDPSAPFANYGHNGTTDNIFSIENSTLANAGVNGSLSQMLAPSVTATIAAAGRGLVCTSPNLYNASFWVSSDTRRSLLQVKQTAAKALYMFSNKYTDYVNQTDYAPIQRYAEVILNVAEAFARTTPLDPRALILLNQVRNRAVAVADQYTAASFATGTSLTQAILNERRIEFTAEGRRWEDISRLANDATFAPVTGGGIPAKILISQIDGVGGTSYNIVTRPQITPSFAAIPYSSFKFIWPLPNTEVANNPTLATQQNPGY